MRHKPFYSHLLWILSLMVLLAICAQITRQLNRPHAAPPCSTPDGELTRKHVTVPRPSQI